METRWTYYTRCPLGTAACLSKSDYTQRILKQVLKLRMYVTGTLCYVSAATGSASAQCMISICSALGVALLLSVHTSQWSVFH